MGGDVSKLDENDWPLASGRLPSGDCSSTIDGTSPTTQYGVYYVTKRGLNQREFDVTDAQQNLLYTTRAVPKTLACFDVLGRELNQFLLRVYVDLARRYWIVCRYGVPSFSGQLPDQQATTKVALEYAERQEPCSTPVLFRKCCVVVSWSRYSALAAMYGPPTVGMLLDSTSNDPSKSEAVSDSNEDSLFMQGTQIASRMKARHDDQQPSDVENPSQLTEPPIELEDVTAELKAHEVKDDPRVRISEEPPIEVAPSSVKHDGEPIISTAVSMPELHDDDEVASTEPILTRSASNVSQGSPAFATATALQQWWSTQSQTILHQSRSLGQKSTQFLNQQAAILKEKQPRVVTDPLEGAIQLDGPLLLCQEVYNRIIGNHQTSLVTKAMVLELLQQDKQYLAEHSNEFRSGELDASEVDLQSEASASGSGGKAKTSGVDGSCDAEPIGGDSMDQPLVGFWAWENTLRTHQMKMHVAKDADLALHVVLAIIANQVRYERNAIAMTV